MAGAYKPETIEPREPSEAEREAAEQVLDALAAAARRRRASELVYARVDLVPGADGQPRPCSSSSSTEPSMFLDPRRHRGAASADRFAAAIAGRCPVAHG